MFLLLGCLIFGFQGQDSLTLKHFYLSFLLRNFQLKTLLEDKTVIVELGESKPSYIISMQKLTYDCELFPEYF